MSWWMWYKPESESNKVQSRRREHEICLGFEKQYPKHCPVKLRAGDGVSVGPCWHYLIDGQTCPVHGVVK